MIEVKHLTRKYGGFTAVNDVSFCVPDGEICGLLGPNGAGKTTTMNMMCGCLAATSGEVYYDGLEIYADKNKVKRKIGYLPERPPLYVDMTVGEYLVFVASAKRVARGDIPAEIGRVCEACNLDEVYERPIKTLSKGFQQRVGIAQALIGDPDVVILDEPTVGLDPIQIIDIRDLVKQLATTHTVIVSSHILSEIRALCSHVVIISKGHIVADGAPDELERLLAGSATVHLCARGASDEVCRIASGVDGVKSVEVEGAEETEQPSGEGPSDDELPEGELSESEEVQPSGEEPSDDEPPDDELPESEEPSDDEVPDDDVQLSDDEPSDDECESDPATCIVVTPDEDVDVREALFFAFADAHIPLIEMRLEQATLEDVFVELTSQGTSGSVDAPESQETPRVTGALEDQEAFAATDVPENQETPAATDVPESQETPAVTEVPESQEIPPDAQDQESQGGEALCEQSSPEN